jgi:putative tricarboxylic transport membrane protein
MRTADRVTAAVLMAIGIVVLLDAMRLGYGWGTDGPESGFFPFWLAVILIVTCSVLLVQTAATAGGRPFVTRAQLVPVAKVLVPATAMVAATQVVGIYVAAAAYLAFYMRWVGRHSWTAVLALAIGLPIVTFVIFERWFLVPLPKGPLEAWLGY